MSITINIYYTGENGNAKRFAQEMLSRGIVEKIRAEEGNIKYEYFLPMNDEKTVLLIDCWKDQMFLDKHHNSPMMQEIIALREKYDLHMQVERYVSDVSENSDDKKFIRE